METKPYFHNIRKVILENLVNAQHEIYIAVAWFTNHDIFNVIVDKAKEIPVHLVVINDDINNRFGGMNFQQFIDAGGKFYFGRKDNLMHNKFCVIDAQVLITGSYNYTYYAETINNENIVVLKDSFEVINAYKNEFHNIVSYLVPVLSISEYLIANPYQRGTFSFSNYGVEDIYQHSIELRDLGLEEESHALLNQIEPGPDSLITGNFIINDVKYRQWKLDYYADKIIVADDNLIICFRTICDKGRCFIHGPKTNHTWILRNSNTKENFIKPARISNIKVNGEKVIATTESEEIFYLSKEGLVDYTTELGYKVNDEKIPVKEDGKPVLISGIKVNQDKFVLSCEIHFNIKDFPLETVDLIEGSGTEKAENHWHCFDINLKLNREKS